MEEKDTSVCRKAEADGETVEIEAFGVPVPSWRQVIPHQRDRNGCDSKRDKVRVCTPKHHERSN